MKIRPLHDRVVIRRVEEETKTAGGILLPGSAAEKPSQGVVVAVGNGIIKDNRTGYPIGVSYPPDWGERTMSLRPGDKTVLQPGMTFHFMTGLWLEDMGLEITESLLITETGVECLANVPRKLFVKD